MSFPRVLFVPLCAAFAAALFAHVGIDVAGDYLLPHDTYDDVAHGSRMLVLGTVAVAFSLLLGFALAAAVREARGSADAFRRSLHSSIALGRLPFAALTIALAAAILASMQLADARAAGAAVDDIGDLFGGSLALGASFVGAAGLVFAYAARRFVRALARLQRTLVAAIAAVFAHRIFRAIGSERFKRSASFASHVAQTLGTSISGRAPPRAGLRFASF